MSRLVKIALGQVAGGHPENASPEEIRAHHRENMLPHFKKAAAEKADVLCFCENALNNGVSASPAEEGAYEDVLTGPGMQWAAARAAEHGLNLIMPTVGLYRGKFQNTAVVLNRKGAVVGVYEKMHLNRAERESGKVAGSSWPVFELDFGRIGIMICHDMHFPEAPRILALKGAELVFWPTHYGAIWGDDYCMALLRATAIYNAVYLASVSLAPKPGEPWRASMSLARSGVLGPRGEWRFSAGFEVGTAVGEIDLDAPLDRPWFSHGKHDDYREEYLADRRPETYGRLLER